jgi:hypothetical protein
MIADRGEPAGEVVDIRKRHVEEEKIFKHWLQEQRRA